MADGTHGWQEKGPFDAIMVTAGAPDIPRDYLDQLAVGGRLVIPVGDRSSQVLVRITRISAKEFKEEKLLGCRFVSLVGNYCWRDESA